MTAEQDRQDLQARWAASGFSRYSPRLVEDPAVTAYALEATPYLRFAEKVVVGHGPDGVVRAERAPTPASGTTRMAAVVPIYGGLGEGVGIILADGPVFVSRFVAQDDADLLRALRTSLPHMVASYR